MDTDGVIHAHPVFISYIFQSVFRDLADVYPNIANGAAPLKVLGAVERLKSTSYIFFFSVQKSERPVFKKNVIRRKGSLIFTDINIILKLMPPQTVLACTGDL